MTQLDLFEEGPQPIQKWLHVWTDAERERNVKKTADRLPRKIDGCKEVHAALDRHVLRRYDQSTSGRNSSHLTNPAVARSIDGQCSAGTRRLPEDH